MCRVILALQSSGAVHLGVDNLGVVRYVGRLLDGHHGSAPFKLVNDDYCQDASSLGSGHGSDSRNSR